MGRPDYEDSVAGNDASSDYVHLIGDSTGALTGSASWGSVVDSVQEGDDGTP